MNFQGLFKNIVFRPVALVTKKLWAILDFFKDQTFLLTCTLPYKLKKLLFIKSKKNIMVNSVKNERARTKKLEGVPNAPNPPSLFRVKLISAPYAYLTI